MQQNFAIPKCSRKHFKGKERKHPRSCPLTPLLSKLPAAPPACQLPFALLRGYTGSAACNLFSDPARSPLLEWLLKPPIPEHPLPCSSEAISVQQPSSSSRNLSLLLPALPSLLALSDLPAVLWCTCNKALSLSTIEHVPKPFQGLTALGIFW